jgi:DNA-binding CsgD family transcriptional regulator
MTQADVTTRVRSGLSAVGLSCTWIWGFFFSSPDSWMRMDAEALSHQLFGPLVLLFLIIIFATGALVELFAPRFSKRYLKPLVMVAVGVLSVLAFISLSEVSSLGGEGSAFEMGGDALIRVSMTVGFCWGFLLYLWARCNAGTELRYAVISLSGSMILTGLLFFLIYLHILPALGSVIILPLLSILLYGLAGWERSQSRLTPVDGWTEDDSAVALPSPITVPSPSVSAPSSPITAPSSSITAPPKLNQTDSTRPRTSLRSLLPHYILYIFVTGFAWGFFPSTTHIDGGTNWAIGGIVTGCLFIFVAWMVRADFSVEFTFALVSIVIALSAFFKLLDPANTVVSHYLLLACFQASHILVLATAASTGMVQPRTGVATICSHMFFFVSSALLGGTIHIFLEDNMTLLLIALIVVLLAAIVLTAMYRDYLFRRVPQGREPTTAADDLESRCILLATQGGLTPRESELIMSLAKGHTLEHISKLMYLSPNTLKTHRTSAYRKLGVSSRQEFLDLLYREDGKG